MRKSSATDNLEEILFEDMFLYGHYIIKTDKDGNIERIDPRRKEEILLSQSKRNK